MANLLRGGAATLGASAALTVMLAAAPSNASTTPTAQNPQPATAQQSKIAQQDCDYRIVKPVWIQFEGTDSALLEAGDMVHGKFRRQGAIWVFSYKHANWGWVTRRDGNMSVITC